VAGDTAGMVVLACYNIMVTVRTTDSLPSFEPVVSHAFASSSYAHGEGS
jgi:hypothetical protein